jgi:thymidine kinase|uniref:thymidine kinase n=1 Tax=viral metagenome TaxID=1070528 RepID=A0A6C0CWY3_9ZZZZ
MGNQSSSNMNQTNIGSLHIYIGSMFAGKSTKLIEWYNTGIQFDEHVVVLTHSIEDRYSKEELSTHNLEKIQCLKYNSIEKFMKEQSIILDSCNTILIDEAQFFPDLIKCVELVEKFGKKIAIFGLDGDFQRQKFGNILDLIPFSDTVEKLHARCNECENNAIFSHRIIQQKEQIVIGSKDIYIPLCRKCYIEKQYNKTI